MPIDASTTTSESRISQFKDNAKAAGQGFVEAFKQADGLSEAAGVDPRQGAGTYKGDLRQAAAHRENNDVSLSDIKGRAYEENRDHNTAALKSFGRDLAGYGLAAAAATPAGVVFQPVFKSIARAAFNGLTAATNPQKGGHTGAAGIGKRLQSFIAAVVSSLKNDGGRVKEFAGKILKEARHADFSTLKEQLLSHKNAPETWGNAMSIVGGLIGLSAGGPLGAIAGFALGKAVGRGLGALVAKAAAPKVDVTDSEGNTKKARGGLSWKATALQAATGGFAGKLGKIDKREGDKVKNQLEGLLNKLGEKQSQLSGKIEALDAKGEVSVKDLRENQKLSREVRDIANQANALAGLLQNSGFGAETVSNGGNDYTLNDLTGDTGLPAIVEAQSQYISDTYGDISTAKDTLKVQMSGSSKEEAKVDVEVPPEVPEAPKPQNVESPTVEIDLNSEDDDKFEDANQELPDVNLQQGPANDEGNGAVPKPGDSDEKKEQV